MDAKPAGEPFIRRLQEGPCLLLDGALGTELIRRGLPLGAPPEAWVLEHPEAVAALHREYVEAGAEAVHTCTFGAHPARLGAFDLAGDMLEIHRTSVGLARASGARFVIGDVGPTGELAPPAGTADPAAWRRGYVREAEILARSGVDALHIETMTDLREARLALETLLDAAPEIPVIVSLSFVRRPGGFFTRAGDALLPSLRILAESGASAVGANCTLAAGDMARLAREALQGIGAPLVIQPAAGQPRRAGQELLYPDTPEEFARELAALIHPPARAPADPAEGTAVRSGAARLGRAAAGPPGRIAALGGCCGTEPRFIAALRSRLA